tara:strand:+ start:2482 stop:2724 length:243 start_codon:yes stop_codon:yes gene_type:complete
VIRIIHKNNKSSKQFGIGFTKYFTIVLDYFKDIENDFCTICLQLHKITLSLQLNKENTNAKKEINQAIKEQKCYDAPAQG